MIEKRFNELYNRAYARGFNTFSDFLNMDEQSILASTHLPCNCYGGWIGAQRVVAGFGEDVQAEDFPICYLLISPVNSKFADSLTHRDFLGGLMNLGIKRELLGDIIVADNCAYLICLEQISTYIIDNLSRVKHTTVKVEMIDSLPDDIIKIPDPTEIIVASPRLDAMLCAVFKLSRNEASRLLAGKKAFVNSRLTESSSYMLKENDVVSLRGYGKFTFVSQLRKTKKNRLVVEVIKY